MLSGESLFNDAVALVAFQVAMTAVVSGRLSWAQAAGTWAWMALGGLAAGAGVAVTAMRLRRHLHSEADDSAAIDTLLSLLTPYAAYLAAEKLGVSGILSVVAAGLCTSLIDRRHLRAPMRAHGKAVWTTVCLALNGAVFVMLGLEIRQVFEQVRGHGGWMLAASVLCLSAALVALRVVWTLLALWWTTNQRQAPAADAPSIGRLFVTALCGVRGALTLTAALSIPLLTAAGTAFPQRDLIVFLAAGTIVTTLLLHARVSLAMGRRGIVQRPATAQRLMS